MFNVHIVTTSNQQQTTSLTMGSDETWTSTEEGISVFFFAFSFLLALVLVLSVSSSCRAVTQSQSKFLNSLALSRNYSMIDQSWPSCSRKRAWFSSWQSYLVILSTYLLWQMRWLLTMTLPLMSHRVYSPSRQKSSFLRSFLPSFSTRDITCGEVRTNFC